MRYCQFRFFILISKISFFTIRRFNFQENAVETFIINKKERFLTKINPEDQRRA